MPDRRDPRSAARRDDVPSGRDVRAEPLPRGPAGAAGSGFDAWDRVIERVPAGTKTEKYMAAGGKFITETLKSLVETGRPSFKSRMILRMIRLTQWTTPKKCLTAKWPLEKPVAQLTST